MYRAERIQAELASAQVTFVTIKLRLAELLGEDHFSVDTLANVQAELAKAKGERDAWQFVVDHHTKPKQQLQALLVNALSRPSGDDWSGRGNDTRRAYNDGFRQVVANNLDRLLND